MSNKSGFTIIELLVIVVVIGILAGVSIFTYGKIRDRADQVAIVTAVKQYASMIEMYIVEHGKAPRADWRCLGDKNTLPAEDGYEENYCFKPANAGTNKGDSAPATPELMAEIAPYSNGLPDVKFPEVQSSIAGSRKYRGVIYDGRTNNFPGDPAILMYFTKFSKCPIGDKVGRWAIGPDVSGCAYRLSVNELGNPRP